VGSAVVDEVSEGGGSNTSPASRSAPLPRDPHYSGACLDPTASDYDCEGRTGNGPRYVVGPI
jgi:hypothetical protein